MDKFEKIANLFINNIKQIDAELLLSDDDHKIYMCEWYPAHSGYAWDYAIVDTLEELEAKLQEEVNEEAISPDQMRDICKSLVERGIY